MRIVRKKNKGNTLLQYNNVKDFDRLKIRKISDIQFFNRCIDGTKFPCLMIEYIVKERELYQFETEKEVLRQENSKLKIIIGFLILIFAGLIGLKIRKVL